MLKLAVIVCLLVVQLKLHVNAENLAENEENKSERKRLIPVMPFPQPHCTLIKRSHPSMFRSPHPFLFHNSCGMNKHGTKRDLRESARKKFMKRIVGGVISADGVWPWMVSITRPDGSHGCGATLISDRWILTAAHCIDETPGKCTGYTVKLGENALQGHSYDRQTYFADLAIVHQGYNPNTMLNDIALMRLSSRVNLAHLDANVICLPSIDAIYNMASCTVSGWGLTIPGSLGKTSPLLRHLSVGELPPNICAQKLGRPLLPGTVCLNSHGTKDACQGDSGGPMVCKDLNNRWVQLGVTSHGTHQSNRCALNTPAVYTDVRFFINWIQDEIVKNGGA